MNQPSPQELHSKIKGLKIIAVVANFQGGAMATKVLYRSRLVTQRSSYSGEFPKKPCEKMRHIFHLMHTTLRKSHNVT